MKFKLKIKKLMIILLVPIGILLMYLSSSAPYFTEKVYSKGINKIIIQALSLFTGMFPFSAAELGVVVIAILFLSYLVKFIKSLIYQSKNRKKAIFKFLMIIVNFICIVYFSYVLLWGINYNRISFAKAANLEIKPSSEQELIGLCKYLINYSNALRTKISENADGVADYSGNFKDMLKDAPQGYKAISEKYPVLGGNYGIPKSIILSPVMNYTGIIGVYCPFTGEANVDTAIPKFTIPATICHEMAHVRGYAREDEANYISYITCIHHPDVFFQYSGVTLALMHSMYALADIDYPQYKDLAKLYSKGLARDLNYNNSFWDNYTGKIEKITDDINNTYLKANGQKDGVQSYGRMIDLLLAEQRERDLSS